MVHKTIGELQHEYLTNLLLCNKVMTLKQASYRLSVLNEYQAKIYLKENK